MKKSEKQEQNQGEVEDEGADRKYQVFNFFLERKSSKLVLMLTTFFLSYIWCTRDTCTRLHFVTIYLFVFYFCKPCQSFGGRVIIKYIILSTGLQKEHFR